MNYRHAFHAGNFADVLKHAVLALVIEHLKKKPAPFRVIDTHAGAGRYDLAGDAAARTGEWADGIGRLLGPSARPLPAAIGALLAPYLDCVRAENPEGGLSVYPGSPVIARRLIRPDDQLIANELHAADNALLRIALARAPNTKVLGLDAYAAVKSLLPPKERRGVVLLDPPFETPDEFGRLAVAVADALARFATGVVIAWYPLKDARSAARFVDGIAEGRRTELMQVELQVRKPHPDGSLAACGLLVANPPFGLKPALDRLLSFLVARLGAGKGARSQVNLRGKDS